VCCEVTVVDCCIVGPWATGLVVGSWLWSVLVVPGGLRAEVRGLVVLVRNRLVCVVVVDCCDHV
jgi:hypothetical protein